MIRRSRTALRCGHACDGQAQEASPAEGFRGSPRSGRSLGAEGGLRSLRARRARRARQADRARLRDLPGRTRPLARRRGGGHLGPRHPGRHAPPQPIGALAGWGWGAARTRCRRASRQRRGRFAPACGGRLDQARQRVPVARSRRPGGCARRERPDPPRACSRTLQQQQARGDGIPGGCPPRRGRASDAGYGEPYRGYRPDLRIPSPRVRPGDGGRR